jgi:hypothetical protein
MTRQVISTGTIANDGTGDTLRSAAIKINQNFAEIYAFLGGGDSSYLAEDITIEDSAIVFAGALNSTRLAAVDPTSDVLVQIPNEDGIIALVGSSQTLTNKTLTTPTISSPIISTAINDSNGNEVIKISPTASAVNEITIANASTGNDPTIQASGEANTNLYLRGASNTGSVQVERLSIDTVDQGSGSTLSLTSVHTFLTATTPASVTVPDGNVTGQLKIITSKKSTPISLTPTSSNIAGVTTAIQLETNESVTLIWDGSSWYITAGYGYSVS